MQERWQHLLNPLQPSSPEVWSVGAGPRIRVIQADEDGIRGLLVNVVEKIGSSGWIRTSNPPVNRRNKKR